MQAGILVRGFIASPSDLPEERNRAVKAVTEWNAINSFDREMMVEAVRVETHAESQLGQHPQKIINSTLLGRCDFLMAIFGSKLGTATDTDISGTVEEIKEIAKRIGGEMVKVFVSEKDLPHDHDRKQLAELDKYKKELRRTALYVPFASADEFEKKFTDQLSIVMNKIDRSEVKAQLWSAKALLSERDKLAIEWERHQFEQSKKLDELTHESMLRQL